MAISGIHKTPQTLTAGADTTSVPPASPLQKSSQDSIQQAQSPAATAEKKNPLSWFKIAVVAVCAIAACAIASFVMKHIFKKEDQAEAFAARLNHYRNQLNQDS